MKKSTILLFGLVVGMIFNGFHALDAQVDSSVLLRIVNIAQKQVERQLANVDVSPEIRELYENGVSEVDLLKTAINNDDTPSIKNHFLKAMNYFKQITRALSDVPKTEKLNDEIISQRNYDSDLKRIKKLVSTLKSITKDKEISFEQIDKLIEKTQTEIQKNNHKDVPHLLKEIKLLLAKIQKELRQHSMRTSINREIKFFSTMIDRLEQKNVDAEKLNEVKSLFSEFKEMIAKEKYKEAQSIKKELTNIIRELYRSI